MPMKERESMQFRETSSQVLPKQHWLMSECLLQPHEYLEVLTHIQCPPHIHCLAPVYCNFPLPPFSCSSVPAGGEASTTFTISPKNALEPVRSLTVTFESNQLEGIMGHTEVRVVA